MSFLAGITAPRQGGKSKLHAEVTITIALRLSLLFLLLLLPVLLHF